jgi:hypothetical protein
MQFRKRLCSAISVAACAAVIVISSGAFGQTVPGRATVPGHPATPKQEPCWQVAGISKSAMDQRKSILQNAHSQVEAVCANSSLTAQQRSEQIRQIHQQSKQQIDALIPASQMESLHSCQASRASAHPSAPHHAGSSSGPCGELPGASGSPTPGTPGSKPEPEEPEN